MNFGKWFDRSMSEMDSAKYLLNVLSESDPVTADELTKEYERWMDDVAFSVYLDMLLDQLTVKLTAYTPLHMFVGWHGDTYGLWPIDGADMWSAPAVNYEEFQGPPICKSQEAEYVFVSLFDIDYYEFFESQRLPRCDIYGNIWTATVSLYVEKAITEIWATSSDKPETGTYHLIWQRESVEWTTS